MKRPGEGGKGILRVEKIDEKDGGYSSNEETPPAFGVPTRALLGSPVEESPQEKK